MPLHPTALGGRNARCRGQARILTDVFTRVGVINLAWLATLGYQHGPGGWAIARPPPQHRSARAP